jgi:hypothetical protein
MKQFKDEKKPLLEAAFWGFAGSAPGSNGGP